MLLNEDASNVKWVFPNHIEDDRAGACPSTLILTTEFDHFRGAAEEAADIFGRNGKLLDFGILAGTFHEAAFLDWDLKKTDAWFTAISRACIKHLPQPLTRSILDDLSHTLYTKAF
jgi:hypothetical protein